MQRTTPIRIASVISGALASLLLAFAVLAAEYPTRPVSLIVAFPPGGPSDVLARILGRKLEQILGQPFVIDNRPGAGGNIAAEAVSAPRRMATRCSWATTAFSRQCEPLPAPRLRPAEGF